MKNNIKLLLCAGVLLATASCSDFLEESPKSSLTTAAYITTAEQALSNTNYLYRVGVPSFYGNCSAYTGNDAMCGGYISGYFDNEYGQESISIYPASLNHNSQNIAEEMDLIWDEAYSTINVANLGIEQIPNVEGISDALATQYLAESKFFRAYNYFYLVKAFGDVPLSLTASSSAEALQIPRTPASEVYAQIEADLLDAVAGLSNTSFNASSGRITRPVAYALLADVYLTWSGYPVLDDHYAEAAAAAQQVIGTGFHSLTLGADDGENSAYNKLRSTDYLPESIYSYEFVTGISTSGWACSSFPAEAMGWGCFTYAMIINNYRARSGLIQNIYDPATDLRIQNQQMYVTSYSYDLGEGEVVREFTPASNYLYFNEEAMLNTNYDDKDRDLYRYAEILLIAAEALVESGGSKTTAAGYLAQVKARAELGAYANYTAIVSELTAELAALSDSDFVEEVWGERLRELLLGFKIWDDICRTRQYPTVDAANPGVITYVNVIGADNNWGQTFTENHLLWPISYNEMQRNSALTQNPGY